MIMIHSFMYFMILDLSESLLEIRGRELDVGWHRNVSGFFSEKNSFSEISPSESFRCITLPSVFVDTNERERESSSKLMI
jgi:hypothetical protein